MLLLAAAMLFRLNQLVLPQLSVLGFSDSEFADRKAERAEAQLVCSYLGPDDRVFYVSQGDNGEGWFSAVFDFYPVLVDYSGAVSHHGGRRRHLRPGRAGAGGGRASKKYYYHPYTSPAPGRDHPGKTGCTVLYLQQIDEIFVESYAELFTRRPGRCAKRRDAALPRHRSGLCPGGDGGDRPMKDKPRRGPLAALARLTARRGGLAVLCYLLALAAWLALGAWNFAADALARADGALAEESIPVGDFQLVDVAPEADGWYATAGGRPAESFWTDVDGRVVRTPELHRRV